MQHILTNELVGKSTIGQSVIHKCKRIKKKKKVNMFESEDMEAKHDYTISLCNQAVP